MRLFYLLFFLLSSTFSSAQIEFDPPSLEFIATDMADYISYNVQIINSTEEVIEAHWTFEPGENFPEDWEVQIHNLNIGYYYGTYMSNCSLPNEIPNTENFHIGFLFRVRKLDYGPMTQSSYGILRFYSDCERTNEIAATAVPTVATDNINIPDISLFPNPTTNSFQLLNDVEVSKVTIYNLLGQQVSQLNHITGSNHDISSLSQGLYMVRMEDKNGRTIKTITLHKQ